MLCVSIVWSLTAFGCAMLYIFWSSSDLQKVQPVPGWRVDCKDCSERSRSILCAMEFIWLFVLVGALPHLQSGRKCRPLLQPGFYFPPFMDWTQGPLHGCQGEPSNRIYSVVRVILLLFFTNFEVLFFFFLSYLSILYLDSGCHLVHNWHCYVGLWGWFP